MIRVHFAKAAAFVTCALLMAAPAVRAAQDEAADLRIVVIEGEDSVNIIAQGTAVPTLVEVRDRNDLPVSGAAVMFLLGEGGAATLNAGLQQVALTTNALGQAAVTVNPVASGLVELSVTATYSGQTATAAIVQTNFATAAQAAAAGAGTAGGTGGGAAAGGAGSGAAAGGGAAAAGGLGTGAIVGIAGGAAAAAGLAVAASGGDDASTSAAPSSPPAPPATEPAAPSAPMVTAGDAQLEVSWTAPSDGGSAINDYDVRYRPVFFGTWTELPDSTRSAATSATIPGLNNGTTYQVQVRAGNSVGDGPWSDSATGMPVAVPEAPAAPGLTAGEGQLEVSWRAPSNNGSSIDDYDVRYRPAGGSWTELPDTAKSTARSVTITGLRDGTAYEVQVRAGNSIGDGPWSQSAMATPVGVPAAPAAPDVTGGDGQLEVRWTPPSDNGSPIDDYDVRFRGPGGSWSSVRDTEKSTATSATIRGLRNGITFEVQVRAGNSVGDGPWSSSGTGTTGARAVPGRPGAPRLTAGDRQLEVRWTAPANNGTRIDDYDVRYQPAGGSWTELPDTGKSTARSATIRNLRNGTEYQVQVRAGSPAGDGPWSSSARGTPRAAVSSGALASYLGFNVIRHELDEFQDHGAECRSQLGGGFRLADWNDIVAYYDGGGSLTAFTAGLKMSVTDRERQPGEIASGYRVSRNGQPLFAGYRHYYAARGDHNVPSHSHANIDNYHLWLGSWFGTGGYALCYRDDGGTGGTPVSEDRAALIDFYNGTGGSNWSRRRNWTSNRPINEWEGVRTDSNDRVTHLDLNRNRLTGTVPSALGRLTHLQYLNLSGNQLSGPLPSSVVNLTRMREVNLSGNQLRGTIPSSLASVLGRFPDLRVVNLAGNDLSGALPSNLGDLSHLTELDISNNELTGAIPSSLGNISNMRTLRLNGNRLTGSIPAALCKFENTINPQQGSANLSCAGSTTGGASDDRAVLMELYNATDGPNWSNNSNWGSNGPLNGWHGVNAGPDDRVRQLLLGDNQLTGSIPSSLGTLKLGHLELQENRLTGPIPSTLGDLKLHVLDLSSNQLTGSIPSSLGSFPDVRFVLLRENRLTGSIPAALCRFAHQINPQQGGVNLPCAGSTSTSALQAQVAPGDGELVVSWTAASDNGVTFSDYDVRYRPDTHSAAWVEFSDEANSTATSATIAGLTNGTAYQVQVRADDSAWSATAVGIPEAPDERLTFGDAHIEDQRLQQSSGIAPLALPEATGGAGALSYALAPALPAGLLFDAAARTVSGAPSVPSPVATYTYTATDANGDAATLSFVIEVEVSAEEASLRQDALAAQGRALLSSVTGVVGERFRTQPAPAPDDSGQTQGATRSFGEALVSTLSSRTGLGSLAAHGGNASASGVPGADPPGNLTGLNGRPGLVSPASVDGLSTDGPMGGALTSGLGLSGDGLLWGRSFATALSAGADDDGEGGYTVWGAGDRQSFSGSPDAGSYSGDVRSLYLGADRRFGDWLAGAALGRSWGAADYTPSSAGGAQGELTTRLTSLYPYVRGKVSSGLTLWAIGGYGRGEAEDARGADSSGEPGELTMAMAAAGLRQDMLERGGLTLAVVGGAGSLSLSSAGGGLTVSDLSAGVRQARLALEASRTSGAVTPFVQFGGRFDGGDGETGTGLELVAGLRASTPRVDVEARGRWLAVHSAAGYGEFGAMGRLAVKSRPDGTGLRALVTPRWGAADPLSVGEGGMLGSAGASRLRPGASWTPEAQALSLDSEVSYGWRLKRLPGILSSMTSHSRTGFGRDLTRAGFSYFASEEETGGGLRLQFTLGRERWLDQGVGYQLALTMSSAF